MRFPERVLALLCERDLPFTMMHASTSRQSNIVVPTDAFGGTLLRTMLAFIDGQLSMLVIGSDQRIEPRLEFEAFHGSTVKLVEPGLLDTAFPELDINALPPLGNLWGMPVYVDPSVAEMTIVQFYLGSSTDLVQMRTADLFRLVRPVVAGIAECSTIPALQISRPPAEASHAVLTA
ncbi:MAG: YbaK/EbsC family protein [Thermomicrobiales bacterium]